MKQKLKYTELMAKHNEIGKIGEKIAKTFLMKQGFSVLETNYRTKYGEIDIIAKKDNKLRFIEVKSIEISDFSDIKNLKIVPEDNLTKEKLSKIVVSTEIYLKNRGITNEKERQIDLACVYVDTEKQEGRVKFIENI